MSVESWLARSTVEVPAQPSRERSRGADLLLAAGVLTALFAATLPLVRVIDPGPWLIGAIGLATAVLGTGFAARWYRLPGVVVAAAELIVWVLAMTAVFGRSTAVLWVVPTGATFEAVPALLAAAGEQVAESAAPVQAGFALSFLIVGALGLLAVAIDHVVLAARMPLLAAVGLVAVSLIPSIAVPGDIDLVAFVLLGASILFLLRVDTRERQRARDGETGRPSSTPSGGGAAVTALGIGAVAVVVAVVAAPLLPGPPLRTAAGGIAGSGARIDPTLQLGDDLRQPRELEVLTVRSSAPSPPYLRAVTLTRFDGAVWEPDDGRTSPLEALPAVETAPDIEVSEYRTTIDIRDLEAPWLPVPYPATAVTGLDGDWRALTDNRTVVSRSGSTRGQAYEVTSTVPRPSLEQIRASAAGDAPADTVALPGDMPELIADTAREITAGTGNDYDALLAMQSWFRGPEFSYSLDAPVADGFDGSGADAVADFLVQREGYCVHFASAFALMARSLDMPTRIVIGYLPGSSTSTQTQGQTVFSVSSSQLHAWPEVHFEGIGWVAFEPTNSLGVPTGFSPRTPTPGQTASSAPQPTAQPTTAPSASPSRTAGAPGDAGAGASGTTGGRGGVLPTVGVAALVLLVLLAPAAVREVRRRRTGDAAADGQPVAAWALVREQAVDLGIPVPASESPRAFGARLEAERGVDAGAMATLVDAIERASYAEGSATDQASYTDAVAVVTRDLRRGAGFWMRVLAVVAPRSLILRPGRARTRSRDPRAFPA